MTRERRERRERDKRNICQSTDIYIYIYIYIYIEEMRLSRLSRLSRSSGIDVYILAFNTGNIRAATPADSLIRIVFWRFGC